MIYLDTSFLTPLFRQETTSAKVSRFLARQPVGTLSISRWTAIEFASLVSRDVRMAVLSAAHGQQLIAEFDAMIADSLVVLMPTANDFNLAKQYVARFVTQLRGPDALHLAIASNNEVDFVVTLDIGMLYAAKKLKVAARRGIR